MFLSFFLVTELQRRRMHEAFRKLSTPSGYIGKQAFLRDVLGDGIPLSLAEQIYLLCSLGTASNGSGPNPSLGGSAHRGLAFKDVLALLVLITRGTHEEKVKCNRQ